MKQAWNSVSTEVVVKSFEVCGISVCVDGTEDHKINYIKDGEVAVATRDEVKARTRALHEHPDHSDDDDPFDDMMEDEEELDSNEFAIECVLRTVHTDLVQY